MIERVWVEPDCILCGVCSYLAPAVFHVGPDGVRVNEELDLQAQAQQLRRAEEACPMHVIHVDRRRESA